jgi:hypothetical protein
MKYRCIQHTLRCVWMLALKLRQRIEFQINSTLKWYWTVIPIPNVWMSLNRSHEIKISTKPPSSSWPASPFLSTVDDRTTSTHSNPPEHMQASFTRACVGACPFHMRQTRGVSHTPARFAPYTPRYCVTEPPNL